MNRFLDAQEGVYETALLEISNALLAHSGIPIQDILGGIDAPKLRSCMTLFALLLGLRVVRFCCCLTAHNQRLFFSVLILESYIYLRMIY